VIGLPRLRGERAGIAARRTDGAPGGLRMNSQSGGKRKQYEEENWREVSASAAENRGNPQAVHNRKFYLDRNE
jgi:hypothetical protein